MQCVENSSLSVQKPGQPGDLQCDVTGGGFVLHRVRSVSDRLLYIRFFSRSPYFRGFRGWPSFREYNMTTKSANWSKLRKSDTNHQCTHEGLQRPMGKYYILSTRRHYVRDRLTAV